MRVGFARVSTVKRAQDISIAGQRQQLLKAGCDRVISERASAFQPGKKREGWEELWSLVAAGEVTEVVTIDQSRLSRSGDDLEFLQACALKGITVRALSGGIIETESYSGFVTAGVLSVMNRAQSKLISAKVKDGIKRRREAGFYASGYVPFGYQVTKGNLDIHPENFPAARLIWEELEAMQFAVNTWIRKHKADWSPQGLRGWLRNPMLRGIVYGQCDAVKALITFQEYERSMACTKIRTQMRGVSSSRYLLFTSLVKCDKCGYSLCHDFSYKPHPRLKCLHIKCAHYGRGLRVSVVREKVVAALVARSQQMAELASEVDNRESPEERKIRGELLALEAVKHLRGVPALIAKQKTQLAALKKQPTGPRRELLSDLFADPGTLALATDEELRPILIEFVSSIIWPGGLNNCLVTLR